MKKSLFLCIMFLSVLFNICTAWSSESVQKFVTVSDIHFNPFSACEHQPIPCPLLQKLKNTNPQEWNTIFQQTPKQIATYGADTNYWLLQSTIKQLQQVNAKDHPQFVLILGDFLAHNFRGQFKRYTKDKSNANYTQFVKQTLQYLTRQLNQVFPTTNVFPVVGNNDSYTGNYIVVPQGAFLQDTANTWSQFIKTETQRNEFLRTFSDSGYYEITLPNQQKLLVLNTVLFTAKKNKKNMAAAAQQQFTWLRERLAEAKKENAHVIIACHIPMGVDVFTSIKLFLFSIKEFWHPGYNREFDRLIQNNAAIISAILAGHLHMDLWQVVPASTVPMILTPSISPVYGNNPAFKVFNYQSEDLQLQNFETYYLPENISTNASWQLEYSFNNIYQPHCQHCLVINGLTNLPKTGVLADAFKRQYAVGHEHPISRDNDWDPYYWCGMNHLSKQDYLACLKQAVL